jgi:hypothetical protein
MFIRNGKILRVTNQTQKIIVFSVWSEPTDNFIIVFLLFECIILNKRQSVMLLRPDYEVHSSMHLNIKIKRPIILSALKL